MNGADLLLMWTECLWFIFIHRCFARHPGLVGGGACHLMSRVWIVSTIYNIHLVASLLKLWHNIWRKSMVAVVNCFCEWWYILVMDYCKVSKIRYLLCFVERGCVKGMLGGTSFQNVWWRGKESKLVKVVMFSS